MDHFSTDVVDHFSLDKYICLTISSIANLINFKLNKKIAKIIVEGNSNESYLSIKGEMIEKTSLQDIPLIDVLLPYFYSGDFKYVVDVMKNYNEVSYYSPKILPCLCLECMCYMLMKDNEMATYSYNKIQEIVKKANFFDKLIMQSKLNSYLYRLELYKNIVQDRLALEGLDNNVEYNDKFDYVEYNYLFAINSLNNYDFKNAKYYFRLIKDSNKNLFYVKDASIILEWLNV